MQSQSPALASTPRTRRPTRSVLRLLELQEDARAMTDAVMDVAIGERDHLYGRLLCGERQTLAVERDPPREHRKGLNRERLARPAARELGPGDRSTHHGDRTIRRDGVRAGRRVGVAGTRAPQGHR